MVLSPFFVKPGMMVFGIIRNDHYAAACRDTSAPQPLQEGQEGHRVEFACLPRKAEFSVAQPHGTKVSYAAPRRMMQQHRVLGFRRYPTCDNGNRAVESALRPWPRGPPRHFPSGLGVFFMRLLPFGIGLSNGRARFAQSKAQLPEQTLTLPHAQSDPVLPLDPSPPASCRPI